MNNQQIIDQFFAYYSKHDTASLKEVMHEDVIWYFLGDHKFAGVKKGIEEVVAFFDTMGGIMSQSKPTVEKLVVAEKDNYVIECQHIKTNREDGINVDHFVSVLWTIENGKIVSGRHFFADPQAAANFFNSVSA